MLVFPVRNEYAYVRTSKQHLLPSCKPIPRDALQNMILLILFFTWLLISTVYSYVVLDVCLTIVLRHAECDLHDRQNAVNKIIGIIS